MIKRLTIAGIALLALAALAGCEKDQSNVATSKLASQPAWDAATDPFVVPGWTSGDQASWLAQLNARTLNQNEYLRIR
ncbi:MAG: hypothetical protein ABI633_15200 [Burkholderiales bacterium]